MIDKPAKMNLTDVDGLLNLKEKTNKQLRVEGIKWNANSEV